GRAKRKGGGRRQGGRGPGRGARVRSTEGPGATGDETPQPAQAARADAAPGCRAATAGWRLTAGGAASALESLDQARVDQEPVEAARLGAVLAGEEQTVAALHDLLLFLEGGIEGQAGALLHHHRQVGSLDALQRPAR